MIEFEDYKELLTTKPELVFSKEINFPLGQIDYIYDEKTQEEAIKGKKKKEEIKIGETTIHSHNEIAKEVVVWKKQTSKCFEYYLHIKVYDVIKGFENFKELKKVDILRDYNSDKAIEFAEKKIQQYFDLEKWRYEFEKTRDFRNTQNNAR